MGEYEEFTQLFGVPLDYRYLLKSSHFSDATCSIANKALVLTMYNPESGEYSQSSARHRIEDKHSMKEDMFKTVPPTDVEWQDPHT